MQDEYIRNAEVIEWGDGDTVTLWLDQGFYDFKKWSVRVVGIDTPERGQERYKAATAAANAIAPPGTKVVIKSLKKKTKDEVQMSASRFLAQVFVNGVDIAEIMIKEGWNKTEDERAETW